MRLLKFIRLCMLQLKLTPAPAVNQIFSDTAHTVCSQKCRGLYMWLVSP